MTDWYTDELFEIPGSERIVFPVSRLVVDPERYRDDNDEPMSARGMGAVYTRTHDSKALRKSGSREDLLARFYDPHHARLDSWSDKATAYHGHALLIDCHSFPNSPLPCDMDRSEPRPDFCIGTNTKHTPESVVEAAVRAIQAHGYSVLKNRPYSGTLVPQGRLGDSRVTSIMIEVNHRLYMDESTGAKLPTFDLMRAVVQAVCAATVEAWTEFGDLRQPCVVSLDDNYHHMSDPDRWVVATYPTYSQALERARSEVESSLAECNFDFPTYTGFGDDAYIHPEPPRRHFSGWTYAELRCQEVAGSTN